MNFRSREQYIALRPSHMISLTMFALRVHLHQHIREYLNSAMPTPYHVNAAESGIRWPYPVCGSTHLTKHCHGTFCKHLHPVSEKQTRRDLNHTDEVEQDRHQTLVSCVHILYIERV